MLQVNSRVCRYSRSSRGRRGPACPKPHQQQASAADTSAGGWGAETSFTSLFFKNKRNTLSFVLKLMVKDPSESFWKQMSGGSCPSGGGHHACECGQSLGARPEVVGAGRQSWRPTGRSVTVREQRCQTEKQVLVEELQGRHVGFCSFWLFFRCFCKMKI